MTSSGDALIPPFSTRRACLPESVLARLLERRDFVSLLEIVGPNGSSKFRRSREELRLEEHRRAAKTEEKLSVVRLVRRPSDGYSIIELTVADGTAEVHRAMLP